MRFILNKKSLSLVLSFVLLVSTLAVCIGIVPAKAAAFDNLLTNGSLESVSGVWGVTAGFSNRKIPDGQALQVVSGWGVWNYWAHNISLDHTSNAQDGSYAINANIPKSGDNMLIYPNKNSVNTEAIEAGYYTFSFWTKGNNTSAKSKVEIKTADGTLYSAKLAPSEEWKKIEISGIYLESSEVNFATFKDYNATSYHIKFTFAPDGVGETDISIDNISLTRDKNRLSSISGMNSTSEIWGEAQGTGNIAEQIYDKVVSVDEDETITSTAGTKFDQKNNIWKTQYANVGSTDWKNMPLLSGSDLYADKALIYSYPLDTYNADYAKTSHIVIANRDSKAANGKQFKVSISSEKLAQSVGISFVAKKDGLYSLTDLNGGIQIESNYFKNAIIRMVIRVNGERVWKSENLTKKSSPQDYSGVFFNLLEDDVLSVNFEVKTDDGITPSGSAVFYFQPSLMYGAEDYTDRAISDNKNALLVNGWYGYYLENNTEDGILIDRVKDADSDYSLKAKLYKGDSTLDIYPDDTKFDNLELETGYYNFTVMVKTDNESSYLEVKTTDGETYTKAIPKSKKWQEVTVENIYLSDTVKLDTYKEGLYTLIRCVADSEKDTYVRMDDATFTKLNFLSNPDFEQTTLSGWNVNLSGAGADYELASDASSGEQAMKLILGNANDKITLSELALPTGGFTEGYYMLAFDAKGSSELTVKVNHSGSETKKEITLGDEWERFVVKDILLSNGSIDSLEFEAEDQGEVYIDNIEFYRQVGPGGYIDTMYALQADDKLVLPNMPEGYELSVYSSSDEDIIDLDGTITSPEEDTDVTLRLKMTNINDATDTAVSYPVELTVKPFEAQTPDDGNPDDGDDDDGVDEDAIGGSSGGSSSDDEEGVIAAKIGDKAFISLQDAIFAAKKGDVIKIVKDLTVTESLIIPESVELINNGDFESAKFDEDTIKNVPNGQYKYDQEIEYWGFGGWTNTNWATWGWHKDAGINGSAALSLNSPAVTDGNWNHNGQMQAILQNGGVKTDKITTGYYTFSAWVKPEGNLNKVSIQIKGGDGNIQTANPTTKGEWQEVKIDDFYIDSDMGLAYYSSTSPTYSANAKSPWIKLTGDDGLAAGTTYFDNISLKRKSVAIEIDLDGHTINSKVDGSLFESGADLTIGGGNIVVKSDSDKALFNSDSDAKLVLNAMNIDTESSLVNGFDSVKIEDGEYNIGKVTDEENANVTITLGIFSIDVEEYIADFAAIKPYGDGKYKVSAKVVAKIGDKEYTTLQDAIDALKGNGGTIDIVDDIVIKDSLIIPENKELIKNGDFETPAITEDVYVGVSNGQYLTVIPGWRGGKWTNNKKLFVHDFNNGIGGSAALGIDTTSVTGSDGDLRLGISNGSNSLIDTQNLVPGYYDLSVWMYREPKEGKSISGGRVEIKPICAAEAYKATPTKIGEWEELVIEDIYIDEQGLDSLSYGKTDQTSYHLFVNGLKWGNQGRVLIDNISLKRQINDYVINLGDYTITSEVDGYLFDAGHNLVLNGGKITSNGNTDGITSAKQETNVTKNGTDIDLS